MKEAILAAVWSALLVSPASAQEIATSFDELAGRIKFGEKLFITDTRGATIEGRLSNLAGSSLEIRVGRDQAAPPLQLLESNVNNIFVVRRDRLWDGPLIGFAIGAGTAAVIELANSRGAQKFQGGSIVGLGNLSAIVGLVFDLFNRDRVTVYVQKARN